MGQGYIIRDGKKVLVYKPDYLGWVMLTAGVCALIILMASVAYDNVHPVHCTGWVPVKEITAVKHRTVTLLLNDGTTVLVDQPDIKPGQLYCKGYER